MKKSALLTGLALIQSVGALSGFYYLDRLEALTAEKVELEQLASQVQIQMELVAAELQRVQKTSPERLQKIFSAGSEQRRLMVRWVPKDTNAIGWSFTDTTARRISETSIDSGRWLEQSWRREKTRFLGARRLWTQDLRLLFGFVLLFVFFRGLISRFWSDPG